MLRRNRGGGDDKPGAPLWMVTYGDMVTNLLAFFVLLYSFSELDAQKFQAVIAAFQQHSGILTGGGAIQGELPLEGSGLLEQGGMFDGREATIEEQLRKFVQDQGLNESVNVVKTQEGVVVRFSDKVLFDLGKTNLLPEARQILEKLVAVIAPWPNHVRVEGHTDNLPIHTSQYPSNWELSVYRASEVIRFLEDANISSERLSAVGYGEYRPIASNDNAAARRRNRRVDIIVITDQLKEVKADAESTQP